VELLLRGELELELEPGDAAGVMLDPLFGRTVTLGPAGVAVAIALQEPTDLDSLLARLDSAGFAREKVEGTLRLFAMLHLFDGIGDDVRAKIRGIWAGGVELEYRQLEGARHACQGSGMCCRSYRLGPIDPAEADVIRALALREAMPHLPDGDPFGTVEGRLYLRTVDTHCLFLGDDHRCGIHAHFGEDKKPAACREYPVAIKSTFRETLLYNNHQCASHFVALTGGPSLIDAARLTKKTTTGRITLLHPIVFAHEDTPVDYVQFVELESALREAMAAGPPLDQLAHAPAIIDSFVAAARALPLGTDPAPHFTAWRAQVALVAESPPPAPTEEDRADLAALLDTIVGQASILLVDPTSANMDHDMVPLVSEALPLLAELQLRVQAVVPGTTAPPPGEPFASALTASLRQSFAGGLSLPDDRPLSAVGQAAIAIACAFAGARVRSLEALGRGHMLANRVLLPFTRPLFRAHPELVRALVALLPALVSAP
jgi:Fe-S-cluster containining protein